MSKLVLVSCIYLQDEDVKASDLNTRAIYVDERNYPRKTDYVLLSGVELRDGNFEILFYQESGNIWPMVVDMEYQKSFIELNPQILIFDINA